MARGSNSRNRSNERDAHTSLTGPVARAAPRRLTPVTTYLSLIQDLRLWHPQPHTRHPLTTQGLKASVRAASPRPKSSARTKSLLPSAVQFEHPQRVLVCVRRKRRKEVLHALRKTGRRGRGGKKHFNLWSKIRC